MIDNTDDTKSVNPERYKFIIIRTMLKTDSKNCSIRFFYIFDGNPPDFLTVFRNAYPEYYSWLGAL